MPAQKHICVIEPQPDLGPALAALVSLYGMEVKSFNSPKQLFENNGQADSYCILLDGTHSPDEGRATIQELRESGFQRAIIALSKDTSAYAALREAGATDVINHFWVASYLLTRVGDLQPGEGDLPELRRHTIPLRDGTEVHYRLMQPEDADIEQAFVRELSDRSRYLRFFSWLKELPPYMLDNLTHPEFPVSYAIIATIEVDGREKQIGVGRYAPTGEDGTAEYAVVVADDWQSRGIATQLMHGIIMVCAISGFTAVDGIILKENAAMIGLARKLGFETVGHHEEGPGVTKLRKRLATDRSLDD